MKWDEIYAVISDIYPHASLNQGRPEYATVSRRWIGAFLAKSQVDRNIWREAQPGASSELVCASFSLLLWALVEQERLKEGITTPLIFGRVNTVTHSLNWYLCENRDIWYVEPQDDSQRHHSAQPLGFQPQSFYLL